MEDEDFKKVPLEERCVHKQWQARIHAYEELTKLFCQLDDNKSPEFAKYLGLLKKFVTDSHAVGQEKGLEATLAYIESYAHAGKTVGEVMAGIVLKCIAAPKNKTKEVAVHVILTYIEIEKGEAVFEELLKGMEQKNPKIVAACINACTVALREFGSKVVNVKPLVKKISTLFSDRDKGVRNAAQMMVVEIYRWIGAALRSQLTNLKPVQILELDAEFSKIEGEKAVPQRFIRSEQERQAAIALTECGDANDAEELDDDNQQLELDPYELADPVDILSQLPKDFFDKIESKKWQERKEALENVEKLVKTPKLQNGDYGDLVRALKKVVQKDSNVVIVALAGKCMAGIAKGLKKQFQPYASACISCLLEKFKEKKQNVVTAIKEAIDAVYLTTNLETILEDVIEALGNKNPCVKAETALFLARAFTKTLPNLINRKMLKALTSPLRKNINESDPHVRDSSAEAIGTLMKLVGEKTVAPFLVDLEKDALKMSKIKEYCEKAVIVVKISAVKKEKTAIIKSTAVKTKSVAKSANVQTTQKKKSADQTSGNVASKSKSTHQFEKELNEEEVDDILSNYISASVIMDMEHSDLKTRLSALEQLSEMMKSLDPSEVPTQAIVKCLCQKPGLKDTNCQLLQTKLGLIKYLAENTNFSTTTATLCVNDIMETFGDAKIEVLVQDTMTVIAEATGFPFVSSFVIDSIGNQKSSKVVIGAFSWLSNAIKEFGFGDLDAYLLIEGGKKALSSNNSSVRRAAITFFGVLYLYIHDLLYTYFDNEKASLREEIYAEFEKHRGTKPPTPTRGMSKSTSAVEENSEPTAQRKRRSKTDISSQITESLLSELDNKDWKVRIETLNKINNILQEAKSIKPNLGDLPEALSRRLTDSNKNVAEKALNVCSTIAETVGSPAKQYLKIFCPLFLRHFGDNKSQLRAVAKQTIEKYAEHDSYAELFENEMIFAALKSGTQLLRIELWDWLAGILPKVPVKMIPKEDLVSCIPLLYSAIEDRSQDVRNNSRKAIFGFMLHIGYDTMVKQTEKLKPGSKSDIQKMLNEERGNLPIQMIPFNRSEKEVKTIKRTKSVISKDTKVHNRLTLATNKNKKDQDSDASSLLTVNNLKQQRILDESKLKILKWNFTTPRQEFVDLLRDQMVAANVNKTLIENMFNSNFGHHIKALELLTDDIAGNGPALVANLDLILKWLTLRFFDTNPSVIFKGLEYLQAVFSTLKDLDYCLGEGEANGFIPYLVMKIGDAKFSSGVRSILQQISLVYPVNRLFAHIMDGVKSKNARQRAECLEVAGTIIHEHGISVCGSSPVAAVKEVAKQISDKDKSVRNAALNCMVEVYNILDEKIYKIIGKIPAKDLSLLEGRIKHSKRTTIPKPPNTDVQPKPPRDTENENNCIVEEVGEFEERNEQDEIEPPAKGLLFLEGNIKYLKQTTINGSQSVQSMPPREEINESCHNLVKEIGEKPDKKVQEEKESTTLCRSHDGVQTEESNQIQTAMESAQLEQYPVKSIKTRIQSFDTAFLDSELPLTFPVISNIKKIASTDATVSLKGLKYISDILQSSKYYVMLDFQDEFIGSIVQQLKHLHSQGHSDDSQVASIYEMILTAVDLFYRNDHFGLKVSQKNLENVLDLFVDILVLGYLSDFHNGNVYIRVVNCHCIKIIETSDHTKIICSLLKLIRVHLKNDSINSRVNLIMKGLWRAIKLMPSWRKDLDYSLILLEVHNFLKEFPSSWWKDKSDVVLRTVKTVIYSCIETKRGNIMLHLDKIKDRSQSEIETYILKVLKNLNIFNIPQPPAYTFPLPEETSVKLTKTSQTIKMINEFIQDYPNSEIDELLKRSANLFQNHLDEQMDKIEDSLGFKIDIEEIEEKALESLPTYFETSEKFNIEYWQQRLEGYKRELPNLGSAVRTEKISSTDDCLSGWNF